MKKQWLISTVCGLALLAGGCSTGKQPSVSGQATEATTEAATEAITEATTEAATEANKKIDKAALFSQMAGDYNCTTGTHGGTILTIEKDGTFAGVGAYFQNEIYEDGSNQMTNRHSTFSGTFQDVYQKNEYTYSTDISELTYQSKTGTEEMIGGILYKYIPADHLDSHDRFYIFTPGTPESMLPDDCKQWLMWEGVLYHNVTELDRYVLFDYDTGDAFAQKIKQSE